MDCASSSDSLTTLMADSGTVVQSGCIVATVQKQMKSEAAIRPMAALWARWARVCKYKTWRYYGRLPERAIGSATMSAHMSARLKVARAASPRPHNVAPPMQRTMMIFAVSEVYMRVERVVKNSCLSDFIPDREVQHFIEDVIDYIMVNEHLRVGKDGAYIWGATLMQVGEFCECLRLFVALKRRFCTRRWSCISLAYTWTSRAHCLVVH